jgi:hypothetical protein
MEDHNDAARKLAVRLGGVSLGCRQFPDDIERVLYRIPSTTV